MAEQAIRRESPILCDLTSDWKIRKSESHLSLGKSIKYKYVIIANKYCWSLAVVQDNSEPKSLKYASNFAGLVCSFKSEAGLDPIDCLKIIVQSLESRTGKKADFEITGSSVDDYILTAKKVDTFFNVDYFVTGDLRSSLFGETGDSNED